MKHFGMPRTSVLALLASVAIVVVAAGSGAVAGSLITSQDIKDKTIKTVDLHKNAVKTQKVKDGTLKVADLSKKAKDKFSKPGPQGPQGPQGPAGPSFFTKVTALTGAWSTSGTAVSLTGDGVAFGPYADGGAAVGSIIYTGMNGQPLSALKNLVYYARYTAAGNTGGVGVPYLRVFLTNNTHDVIFSPNTQSPDPDVAEGPFHEWVATSGSARYDDDGGNNPDVPWSQIVAAHGTETISGIRVSTGNSSGTDLSALLRWLEINGQTYKFTTQ